MVILSIYNIWFMNRFFSQIRNSIKDDKFNVYKNEILSRLN